MSHRRSRLRHANPPRRRSTAPAESKASSVRRGTTMRRPRRKLGSSPRGTSSYARTREMPRRPAASVTLSTSCPSRVIAFSSPANGRACSHEAQARERGRPRRGTRELRNSRTRPSREEPSDTCPRGGRDRRGAALVLSTASVYGSGLNGSLSESLYRGRDLADTSSERSDNGGCACQRGMRCQRRRSPDEVELATHDRLRGCAHVLDVSYSRLCWSDFSCEDLCFLAAP
jgi:hypothetical protein